MIDFAESGELSVFIDEEQLAALEDRMNRTGYLDGRAMATTFNMLRANDLIWSFVINNYLMGKETFPFDLLYWNSDTTSMPAAMHSLDLLPLSTQNEPVNPAIITMAGPALHLGSKPLPTSVRPPKAHPSPTVRSLHTGPPYY